MQHVFFYCTFALQVWIRAGLWSEVQHACTHASSTAALLWSLWKHQNLRLWQGENETVAQVVDRARHLMEDWNLANTPTAEANGSCSEVQNSRADVYNNRTDPHNSTTVTRSRTEAHLNITDAQNSSMNAHGAAAPSTSFVST